MKKIFLIGLILTGCSGTPTHNSAGTDVERKPSGSNPEETSASYSVQASPSDTYPQNEGQCTQATGVWREGNCYCAFGAQNPHEIAIQLVTKGARTYPSNLSLTLGGLAVNSYTIIGVIDKEVKKHNCEAIGHRTFDIAVSDLRASGAGGSESELRLIDVVTVLQNTLYRDRVLTPTK